MKKTGTEERVKFTYEPPVAVELSGHRVNGQQNDPKAFCISGSQPGGCSVGSSFTQENCKTGLAPKWGHCKPGTYPWNYCGTGSAAS